MLIGAVLAPAAALRASARSLTCLPKNPAASPLGRSACCSCCRRIRSCWSGRRSDNSPSSRAMAAASSGPSKGGPVILWFRNDLRLHDNSVVEAALAAVRTGSASEVLPVFVLDRRFTTDRASRLAAAADLRKCGARRAQFLLESARDLRESLRARGSDLLVKVGLPEEILPALASSAGTGSPPAFVIAHAEAAAEEVAVEAAVASALAPLGGSLRLLWGHTLLHPDDLGIPPQEIPIVFAPFNKRAVEQNGAAPRLPVPSERFGAGELPVARAAAPEAEWAARLPSLRELGYTDSEPAEPSPLGVLSFQGGETAALARLRHYLWGSDSVASYFDTRNGMLGPDYSTKFSPWLALGCLSPRTVAAEVARYEAERVKNKSTGWISFELLVRDWMRFLFLRHGRKMFLRGGVSGSDWRWCPEPEQSARFAAWKEGRTGWPLVDANMRELTATGFMSNRGRQNVASFLTQNMNVDWRLGAAFFEEQLLDHDPCSNTANWLFAAGITEGRRTDVFDILRQSAVYDPQGEYVRHWLPELRAVPVEHVHSPCAMPAELQRSSGCVVGQDYPAPMCSGRLEGPGAAEVRERAEAARVKAEAAAAAAAAGRNKGARAGGGGGAGGRGGGGTKQAPIAAKPGPGGE